MLEAHLGRFAFRTLRPFRNWSLRSADINVVVGERHGRAFCEGKGLVGEHIRVIPNWSDGTLIVPIGHRNRTRSARAGHQKPFCRRLCWQSRPRSRRRYDNRSNNPPPGTGSQVARRRSSREQIMFVFVGGGAQRARLEREVLKRALTNVRLHPYQPRERLAETLGSADVHLVSLNPKLEGLIVPSKFYGIAAAGRPTLFIGAANGEIARLIEEFECGFTINPGDGKGLADRILQLAQDPQLCAALGARARTAFEKHWDKRRAVEKWDEVLKAVATSSAKQRPPNGFGPFVRCSERSREPAPAELIGSFPALTTLVRARHRSRARYLGVR